MKKIILGLATITLFALEACKKIQTEPTSKDLTTTNDLIKPSESSSRVGVRPQIIYQASNSFLTNASNNFIGRVVANLNLNSTTIRPTPYTSFSNTNSIISSVINNSGGCVTGTLDITYQVTTIETYGYQYALNYSGNLTVGSSPFVYSPTSFTPFGTPQILNQSSTLYCATPIVASTFNVTFSVPANLYELAAASDINITATSTGPLLAPYTISENVSFTYSNDYYTMSPARIFVNSGIPGGSGIGVYTQCGLGCYSLHTICPNSGVFSYRLLGSNDPYTNVNLNSLGASIPTSSGTYEYICTLAYSFGTSLPFTGTIFVP